MAIHPVDPRHRFAGGRSPAEQEQETTLLDVKVVDGSNTKAETSDDLAAVFAALADLLGAVHTESDCLVHEVPAAATGYGGRTQRYRFLRGRLRAQASAPRTP